MAILAAHRSRRGIRPRNFTESVSFKGQQPVHISYIPQVFFPSRVRADRLFPGVDQLENACHDRSWEGRRPFRKPTDEFIEELFRADLQMKSVSAHLNEGVEEGESQHGDMGVSMIDESDGQCRSLPRPLMVLMRMDLMI
jgi:hypothetical protein